MKKISCILLGLLFTGILSAQSDSANLPAFRKFPTIPPFKILETDSVTFFSKADLKKNKPVLIILFSPDCDHCKHETEELIKHMDDFKQVQIVMATTMPFAKMKEFYANYKLASFKNIKVGHDTQYLLPVFYQIGSLPYLAMYDKNGNLINTFEGTMKMEELAAIFK
jgi:thioredoxin-related protein